MKLLFDTSVFVSALITSHPRHEIAYPWLERAKVRDFELVASSHSLAELYSILSTYPSRPRFSPAECRSAIRENVETVATIVPLSASDYAVVLDEAASRGFSGGIVFDALIVRAARKAQVDRILTLNVNHFRRVWPEGADRIGAP